MYHPSLHVTLRGKHYDLHFADEESKTERSKNTFPKIT